MTILENKFVQWVIVIIVVTFVKSMASLILNVPSYPAEGLFALFDVRDWASMAYLMIHDLGELAKGAYLLRAIGLIEFVK